MSMKRKHAMRKPFRRVKAKNAPRRKRFARRKTTDYNTRSLHAASGGYRSKKLSKRLWRKRLWDATLMSVHFRSIGAVQNTITTPASSLAMTWNIFAMFDSSNPFWTSTGGLLPTTVGSAALSLTPQTVTVRGGKYGVVLTNIDNNDEMTIQARLCYAKQQRNQLNTQTTTNMPIIAYIAAINALAPVIGTNMEDEADFSQFFYPAILDRKMTLKPGDSFTVERYMKPVRIDTDAFRAGMTFFPYWMISVYNTSSASANICNVQTYFNLSFAEGPI